VQRAHSTKNSNAADLFSTKRAATAPGSGDESLKHHRQSSITKDICSGLTPSPKTGLVQQTVQIAASAI
jgi:hypothetical protein